MGDFVRRPLAQDAALAVVLVLTAVVVNDQEIGPTGLWWLATGLALAGVALRRRWPIAMLVVCCAAAGLHLAGAMPLTVVDLSVPILLYGVAVRHGWALSLVALAALLLLVLGSSSFARTERVPPTGVQGRPPQPVPVPAPLAAESWVIVWNDLPGLALTLIAACAIGSGTRSRRAYLAESRARAVDRERERGQRAVLALAAERARISRELHDVVAHGLSVMVVQAQGAAAALDHRPADTRTALDAIIRTGRDSLADMRRVLATVGAVDDAWHPQPGLAALPALLTQVPSATLRVEGTPVPLPSAVDLCAYRIVQEALTNTMKHAGPGARADVVVSYLENRIGVAVGDDGCGPVPGDGRGTGLRGMRERVTLLGGTFTAGPGPINGFRVRAELPVAEPQP